MALSMSSFIPSGSAISSFMEVILWGTLAFMILVVIGVAIRNKIKYAYEAEVYKRRQEDFEDNEPKAVRIQGKAGYFIKRRKTVFRIKYGMMPWMVIELSKLPDPQYMIGNKVIYFQLQKDNYVQSKIDVDWVGVFKLEPVEDDLKYGAQLDMQEKKAILTTESPWQKYGGPITMGLVLVAGIVALYFQTKACG